MFDGTNLTLFKLSAFYLESQNQIFIMTGTNDFFSEIRLNIFEVLNPNKTSGDDGIYHKMVNNVFKSATKSFVF